MKILSNYTLFGYLVIILSFRYNFADTQAYTCTTQSENINLEANSLSAAKSKAIFRCMVTYKAGASCYKQITCRRQAESILSQAHHKNWHMVVFLASAGLAGAIGLISLMYCYYAEKRGSMRLAQDV